jgi:hypothetical protein
MAKRRSDDLDDDDLFARLSSRSVLGPTFFWLILWAICDFNPWVGFGFFFAWGGSIGLFEDAKKKSKMKAKAEAESDDRGYQPSLESQNASVIDERAATALAMPLHRQIIADAQPSQARLEAAASVGDGQLGARLRAMVARVKKVASGLDADPSRLSDVQRLFTYYLPATADLLAARGNLVASGDSARLAEIDAMIGKLGLAYDDFAARLAGHDARSLEIDLRLLDQALDQEFVMKTKV